MTGSQPEGGHRSEPGVPSGSAEGSLASPSGPVLDPGTREAIGGGLVAVGIAVLIFVLFRRIRARQRTHQPMDEPARDRIERLKASAATSHDVHALTATAQASVQSLISQLEAKAARLEALLDRTEARLAAYESRLAEMEASTVRERVVPAQREATGSIDPMHSKVHELADQGLDPVEIARRLDRPTGQVELILALRRA